MGVKEKKYVVTGVNRLTGERECISRPHDYLMTDRMLRRYQAEYAGKRRPAYTRLRMEESAVQLPLPLERGTAKA